MKAINLSSKFGKKNRKLPRKNQSKKYQPSLMTTLIIKYNIPRWYITLLVPAAVAALLLGLTLITGIVVPSDVKSFSKQQSEAEKKAEAYQELIKQQEIAQRGVNATAGGSSTGESSAPVSTKDRVKALEEKYVPSQVRGYINFDTILVASFVIGLAPYSYDITKHKQAVKRREREFATFLFELSELVRGGIDPIRAITLLSDRDLGSITKFVRIAAKQTVLGYSFEHAMRNLETLIESKLVRNYTDLVVQASYSGGSVSDLIRKASLDMQTFITLEEEKLTGLKQYQVILYASQVILIGVCVILISQFLPGLQGLSFQGGTGDIGFLAKADIAQVTVERNLFYLVTINGFLGGLVIGKISEGTIKDGLKHSLLILLIALVAWQVMIKAPATETVHITVLSYPDTGYASLPLSKPIIVNVTAQDGKPKAQYNVKFSVTPSGKAFPSSVNTGFDGDARTTIMLGPTPGPYHVEISAGDQKEIVVINAKDPGGGGN